MTLQPGEKIGSYEVVSLLGRGGMGEVWLGRDPRLERDVAIKVVPDLLAADEERRQRFEREAKILASLSHPNIAGLHGLEEVDGQRFLIMEYVAGTTLDERLGDGGLGVDASLRICRQVAEALESAHRNGVVHRDLKPANIMVRDDDTVKVLDFGLARTGGEESSGSSGRTEHESPTITENFTAPGVVLGTAPYMSPEQARGRSIDKRSDIWSFGVILYECLTGTRLFAGETATDSMGAILHKDLSFVALPAGTPPTVQLLLRRCLTRERKKRLQDIGDARIELEAALDDPSGSSLGLAAVALEAPRRPGARLPWAIAALCFVVAVVALAAPRLFDASAPAPPSAPVRMSMVFRDEVRMSAGFRSTERGNLSFDVSPRGDAVVFEAAHESQWALYLRRFHEASPHRIPGTEDGGNPVFSPDGRRIVFSTWGARRTILKRVTLDNTLPAEIPQASGVAWAGTWYSASELLVFVDDGKALGRLDVETGRLDSLPGAERLLAEIKEAGADPCYAVTVPGRPDTVLIQRYDDDAKDHRTDVWAVSLGDGTACRLDRGAAGPRVTADGRVFFLRDQVLMGGFLDPDTLQLQRSESLMVEKVSQFAVTRGGDLVFVPGVETDFGGRLLIAAPGAAPEPLTEDAKTFVGVAISPDGKRILTRVWDEDRKSTLWVCDRGTGVGQPIVDTGSGWNVSAGLWTPDGNSVVYWQALPGAADNAPDRERAPSGHVWRIPADGSMAPELLFQQEVERGSLHGWSPDGAWLVMSSRDRILLRSVATGESKDLVTRARGAASPALSPDGRRLVFVSRVSGEPRIYVQELDEDLTPRGMRQPLGYGRGARVLRWSRDGSRLYFNAEDGLTLSYVEVAADRSLTDLKPQLGLKLESRIWSWDVGPNHEIVFGEMKMAGQLAHFDVILNWAKSLEAKTVPATEPR